jgi:allantoinase
LRVDPKTFTEVILNDTPYAINAYEFESKARHSPFDGHMITGRVANVELRGIKVLQEGKIIGLPQGRLI